MATNRNRMQNSSIREMIAKTELSAKIAQIALACPSCNGPVNKEIQEYQNNHNQQNNNNGFGPIRGHSSLPATNERDGFATEAVNPNDCKYHTQQYT
jgi:hypothetical protein